MSELWDSTLLRRETVARDTVACVLRRPPGFAFTAGQYLEVTLVPPRFDDSLGPTRAMSIASAPVDDHLVLLMRLRDTAFKRAIAVLAPGAPLRLEGPIDDLRFDLRSERPMVLLAGGVGIAPFRALLREAAAASGRLDGALFYSNRRPDDAPYLEELARLTTAVGMRFVPTMTRPVEARPPWTAETERLGADMIHRRVPRSRNARYYVCGSTLFVSGLCYDLEQHGVPPRDIAAELYAGY